MASQIDELLHAAHESGASDLHLRVGLPAMIRIDGRLYGVSDRTLDAKEVAQIVDPLLDGERRRSLEERRVSEFLHTEPGMASFRVSIFHERGALAGVFRRLSEKVPTLYEVAAPRILLNWAERSRGLILVTGPTGSGKTTTLAAMIERISRVHPGGHILTLEDPVEFVHSQGASIITQRELGRDVRSFADGLREGLRQDPDVILVGELRDTETIRTALAAAETGHLVLATTHTSSAPGAATRIIEAFGDADQSLARVLLAGSLLGVVGQTLVPRVGGGRIAAHEIMVADAAVRSALRKGEIERKGRGFLQNGSEGSQTLDRSLADLVVRGEIEEETAFTVAQEKVDLQTNLRVMRSGGQVPVQSRVTPADYGVGVPQPFEEMAA